MSNIIPPLLSSSPPPIITNDEEEDDEFGDFTAAVDLSYNCGSLSLPDSPQQSPAKAPNNTTHQNNVNIFSQPEPTIENNLNAKPLQKDFQDKRKVKLLCDTNSINIVEPSVNSSCLDCTTVNNISKSNSDFTVDTYLSKVDETKVVLKSGDKQNLQDINECQVPEIEDCLNSDSIVKSSHNNLSNPTAVPCDVPKEISEFNSNLPTKTVSSDLAIESVTSKSLSGSVFDSSENHENREIEPLTNCANHESNQISEEFDEFKTSDFVSQDEFGDFSDSNISLSSTKPEGKNLENSVQSFSTFDSFQHHGTVNNLTLKQNAKDDENDFAIFASHESLKQNFNVDFTTNSTASSISQNNDVAADNPYLEEPPDLPPDLDANDDEMEGYGNHDHSLEIDSEVESHHLPSESLVPYQENKDDFNYVGIIRSVRESTLLVNASLEGISLDECNVKSSETTEKKLSKEKLEFSDSLDVYNEGVEREKFSLERDGDEFGDFKISSINDELIKSLDMNPCNTEEEYKHFKISKSDIEFIDQQEGKNGEGFSFADFDNAPFEVQSKIVEAYQNKDTPEITNNDMEDDTFGDFSTFESEVVTNEPEVQQKVDIVSDSQPTFSEGDDDDFGDFDDYSSNSMGNNTFGDFSASHKDSIFITDPKDVPKQAEKIIVEMFPPVKDECDEYERFDVLKEDYVFKEVRDVTETNALSYQWSKSASQEMLLKALNIDMRNILHGPGWCSSMPKYASNLGGAPLEPVKSEILMPTPAHNAVLTPTPVVMPQPTTNQAEIPSAQFDWTSSGLTNPLDYLEQLAASLDIPSTSTPNPESRNSISPSKEYDDWDQWLKTLAKDSSGKTSLPDPLTVLKLDDQVYSSETTFSKFPNHYDNESVNSLQFTETPPELEEAINENSKKMDTEDAFESFSSYKPVDKTEDCPVSWSPENMMPLRETYITSNNIKEIKLDSEPCWLKPTILTPDMPRKANIQTDFDSEDDFSDFQMVLPSEQMDVQNPKVLNTDFDIVATLNNEVSHNEKITNKPINVENIMNINTITPDITKDVSKLSLAQTNVQDSIGDDDDFGSFQSVSNAPTAFNTAPILQPMPILEPLKPTAPVGDIKSGEINWPDPGIIEEADILSAFSYRTTTVPKQNTEGESNLIPTDILPNTPNKPDKLKKSDDSKVFEDIMPDILKPINKKTQLQTLSLNNSPTHDSVAKLNSLPKYLPHKSEVTSESKLDDDDWSDFVSNQEVQPPSQAKPAYNTYGQFKTSERTSTPELQLSIDQLSHIQPPRQPIPVLTPHGLVQTKFSANSSIPKMEPIQLVSNMQWPNKTNEVYQPAIISNQYNAQLNNTFSNFSHTSSYVHNNIPNPGPLVSNSISSNWSQQNGNLSYQMNSNTQVNQYLKTNNVLNNKSANHVMLNSSNMIPNTGTKGFASTKPPEVQRQVVQTSQNDEDDWSDFVSSQPIPAQSHQINSFNGQGKFNHVNWNQNQGPQFSNWTSSNMNPNIITNPGHYESFKAAVPPMNSDFLKSKGVVRRTTTLGVPSKKSSVPSISSLPDLEFVAPKGRTMKK